MNLLRFEFKKLVRQKKYLWLILIVTLTIGALFSLNTYQRSRLQGNWAMHNALNDFRPLTDEWNRREVELIRLRDQGMLSEEQEQQLKHSREMGRNLVFIRGYTSFDRWEDITRAKDSFYNALEKYSQVGGEFSVLEGIQREAAIAKNLWMLEHDIHYEYEGFPISQHLFLKQVSNILLGIVGLLILLVFFGNSITEEKEQRTWLTIKVQPISKLKLVFSKYIAFMLMALLLVLWTIFIGLLIPEVINGRSLNLKYPNVLILGETFSMITLQDYLTRSLVLFLCSSSLLASISFVVSKFVKRSFSLYVLVSIIGVFGYLGTSWIGSPLNPFQILAFRNIENIDLIYYLSTSIWSVLLLGIAAFLPDVRLKTVEVNTDNKPFAKGMTKFRSNLVRNLCIFEWRKLVRENLMALFSLTMVAMIVVGYTLVTREAIMREDMYFNELQFRINESNRIISETREKMDNALNEMGAELEPPKDSIDNFNQIEIENLTYEEAIMALTSIQSKKGQAHQERDQVELNRLLEIERSVIQRIGEIIEQYTYEETLAAIMSIQSDKLHSAFYPTEVEYGVILSIEGMLMQHFEQWSQDDLADLQKINTLLSDFNNYFHSIRDQLEAIDLTNAAIQGYSEGQWSDLYQYQLAINWRAYTDNFYIDGQGSKTGVETLGRFGKMASIREKEWMLENNIQPVFSGDFLPTLFRNWGRHTRIGFGGERVSQLQWEWENRKIDNSGLFFLYLSFTRYAYLAPLLILIFLLGGGIAKERGKKSTFNFLKTQPISGQKIYFSKILSSFAIAFMATLTILFLAVLAGTLYSRFGDWNYPVIHYNTFKDIISPDYTGFADGGRGYHFISLGRYLLNSTILLIALTLFIMGVSIFLSLFIRRPMGVYAASFVILSLGYYRNWRIPLGVSYRSPFTYFSIPRIVNGEMAARLNEPRFNVLTGVIVLVGITIVLMAAAYGVINWEKVYLWALDKGQRLKHLMIANRAKKDV